MHPVGNEQLKELERTLHAEIPLTRAMGVRVVRADQYGLVLGAALAPNLNHKKTAFGGSLNSLATLACWGLIQLLLRDRGWAITVVIQESSVQFLKPVMRDFEAVCPPPPAAALEKFLRMLEHKGRAGWNWRRLSIPTVRTRCTFAANSSPTTRRAFRVSSRCSAVAPDHSRAV